MILRYNCTKTRRYLLSCHDRVCVSRKLETEYFLRKEKKKKVNKPVTPSKNVCNEILSKANDSRALLHIISLFSFVPINFV